MRDYQDMGLWLGKYRYIIQMTSETLIVQAGSRMNETLEVWPPIHSHHYHSFLPSLPIHAPNINLHGFCDFGLVSLQFFLTSILTMASDILRPGLSGIRPAFRSEGYGFRICAAPEELVASHEIDEQRLQGCSR